MMDSTQLIVVRGKSTMVLSINSCAQVSNAENGSDTDTDSDRGNRSRAKRRRFAPLARQSIVLQAVLSFFCHKKNDDD